MGALLTVVEVVAVAVFGLLIVSAVVDLIRIRKQHRARMAAFEAQLAENREMAHRLIGEHNAKTTLICARALIRSLNQCGRILMREDAAEILAMVDEVARGSEDEDTRRSAEEIRLLLDYCTIQQEGTVH